MFGIHPYSLKFSFDKTDILKKNLYYKYFSINFDNNYLMFDYKSYFISPYVISVFLKNWNFNSLKKNYDDFGWKKIENNFKFSFKDKKELNKRFLFLEKSTDKNIVKRRIGLLEEFLVSSKNEKIRVVFIILPINSAFYNLLSEKNSFHDVRKIYELTKKHNIAFYDYSSDMRFGDNDFSDYDHLNYKGATKLSNILNKELFK